MGRQVNYYMDEETKKRFQEYILSQGLCIITDYGEVVNNIFYGIKLYIVKPEDMKKIKMLVTSNGIRYIDEDESYVIECCPGVLRKEEKLIINGRIYVILSYINEKDEIVHKDKEILRTYEKLGRWIKKNCPMTEYVEDGYLCKAYMSSEVKRMVEEEGYRL